MIFFPTTLVRARITVGAVAAFACLALSGVAAAAPTVYVHLGQMSVQPKYADKPARFEQSQDTGTCGVAQINASKDWIKVEAIIRGGKSNRRPRANISFSDGRAVADKPIPLIGLLALHGTVVFSESGLETRTICAKHSKFLSRKRWSVPKRIRLRDMRIETWEKWKRIHPDRLVDRIPDTIAGYRKDLFRIMHLRGYRESEHKARLQKFCNDAYSYYHGSPVPQDTSWACEDRGLIPGG